MFIFVKIYDYARKTAQIDEKRETFIKPSG